MQNYIYVLMIIIFLFIIFIIGEIGKTEDDNLKLLLFDTSLFFDQMQNISNINIQSFQPFKKISLKILKKLYNLGYYQSKLIIINQQNCLQFDVNNNLEICNGYENICAKCKYLWKKINYNKGILLRNNLLQIYDNNGDIFLYKNYKFKNNILAIGIILRV